MRSSSRAVAPEARRPRQGRARLRGEHAPGARARGRGGVGPSRRGRRRGSRECASRRAGRPGGTRPLGSGQRCDGGRRRSDLRRFDSDLGVRARVRRGAFRGGDRRAPGGCGCASGCRRIRAGRRGRTPPGSRRAVPRRCASGRARCDRRGRRQLDEAAARTVAPGGGRGRRGRDRRRRHSGAGGGARHQASACFDACWRPRWRMLGSGPTNSGRRG